MVLLALIPLFTTIVGLLLYRFQGKFFELFRLDFVQFIYMFLMAPALFVWLKTFLFYLIRNELEITLSITEIFVIDTVFTVISIFVMGAIAIHSLTKTFWIKRHHDPDFDLYHLSEYFHLWWSHIIIWGGIMLMFTFLSLTNVLIPLDFELTKIWFLVTQAVAIVCGTIFFFAIWMSESDQGNFMRLMKILLVLVALIHIIVYFVLDPGYNSNYIAYWFVTTGFTTSAAIGGFFERSEKVGFFRSFFLHVGWGDNKGVVLFPKKKTTPKK